MNPLKTKDTSTQILAKKTRWWRNIHKSVSIVLLSFFLLTATTGIVLGWKKQTTLLPKTSIGIAPNQPNRWLSIAELTTIAQTYVSDSLQKNTAISRIDIRPEKGTVKFVFKNHFSEIQLDCASGLILSVATRNSDIIEKIHDGSILDYWINEDQSFFKLSYTSLLGLGLLTLSVSGFWMWINPKKIRRQKNKK